MKRKKITASALAALKAKTSLMAGTIASTKEKCEK
jgi:hypothetical protein